MRGEFEKWAEATSFHSGHEVNTPEAFAAWASRQPEIDALKSKVAARGVVIGEGSQEIAALKAEAERYRAVNTPEIKDFVLAIEREALHQRERWGNTHDAGKTDADWYWLIGYLAGKAIRPDATPEKQLHHIITTAAACLNWHAHKLGVFTEMRPSIDGEAAMGGDA